MDNKDYLMKVTQTNLEETTRKLNEANTVITQTTQECKDLTTRIHEEEKIRKRLHNTILELKGNIRVFCRVRPFLGNLV